MPNQFQQRITLDGQEFHLIKTRRNGTALYHSEQGGLYARIGAEREITREREQLIELKKYGFPVAEARSFRVHGARATLVESSLGQLPFGDIFMRETVETGVVSDVSYRAFVAVAEQCIRAQRAALRPSTESVLAHHHAQFVEIASELPHLTTLIERCANTVVSVLHACPATLTHGDFNPFNILHGGIIDFENSFIGVFGYDIVSAVTNHLWFPKHPRVELPEAYSLTPAQRQLFHDTVVAPHGDLLSERVLSSCFLAKACWATFGMSKFPLLQQWRFERFQKLCEDYLQGVAIYDNWVAGRYSEGSINE